MCAIRALLCAMIRCHELSTGPPAIEHVPYSAHGSTIKHLASVRVRPILLSCLRCRVYGANPDLCQELRTIGYNN